MIGSERPVWSPAAGSSCQALRAQLAEAINAIRSQAAGTARLAQALDTVDEGPVTAVTRSEQSVAAVGGDAVWQQDLLQRFGELAPDALLHREALGASENRP
jgi:hypothetical protein